MSEKDFIDKVKELGIDLNKEQLANLNTYYELLVSWNEKINLTAITNKEDVYLKHFYDSLTLTKVIDLNKEESLCDIGTGAGFPGLVLKICFPHLKVTLLDSLNKRLIFLKEVINVLGLKDVTLVHERAEEYALKNREVFDVVTARAVASLNILLEYSIPLVKENKYFIALKGKEENTNSNALNILKAKIIDTKVITLPYEESIRTIIKVQKKEKTPLKYPRRYSDIKKKPL